MLSISEEREPNGEEAEETNRLISQNDDDDVFKSVGAGYEISNDKTKIITAAKELDVEEVEKCLRIHDFTVDLNVEARRCAAWSGEVGDARDDEKTVAILSAIQRAGHGEVSSKWEQLRCCILWLDRSRKLSSVPSSSYDYMTASQVGMIKDI